MPVLNPRAPGLRGGHGFTVGIPRPKLLPLEKPLARSRGVPLSKPFRPRVPRLRLIRFPLRNVFLRPRPKSFPPEKPLARMRGIPRPKFFRRRMSGLRLIRLPGNVFLRSRVPRLHSRFFPLKTIVLRPRPMPFPPGTRFLQPYIIPDFPLDILHSKPSPLRMRFILARARDSCLRTASGLRLRTPAISPDFSPS